MVGTNVGAGQYSRARRIARTGALVSALVTRAIGLMTSLLPQAWIHLFSRESAVVDVGSAYLVRVLSRLRATCGPRFAACSSEVAMADCERVPRTCG